MDAGSSEWVGGWWPLGKYPVLARNVGPRGEDGEFDIRLAADATTANPEVHKHGFGVV